MSNLIGQSLGRYHILEQLGEGGMATVYKAYDTRLETDVAVKVIRTERLAPEILEQSLKRFEREAKSLAKLTHPNIVKVTDYGEHEGKPYLVMPYLPGGTLKEHLKHEAMPWKEAVELLLPIARALEYAHNQNLIHRDVKPSNILLTESGQPMLTDFGVAKLFDMNETTSLTSAGMGIGTPEYMAPEQWTGHATLQTDVYALGLVLYEMMTGRRPYTADTPAALFLKQTNTPPPRPKSLMPSLPDAVEKILLKALEKKPEIRYQDMAAFAKELQDLLAWTPAAINTPRRTAMENTTVQDLKINKPNRALPVYAQPRYLTFWLIGAGMAGIVLVCSLVLFLNRGAVPVSPTHTPSVTSSVSATDTPEAGSIPSETSIPPTNTSTTELGIGSTRTRPVDGMVMMYIPEGSFEMGSPKDFYDNEKPIHTVTLDAYWMDRTEVTNAKYALCVQAGDCRPPLQKSSHERERYYGNSNYDDYPVIYVDWNMAKTYCEWAGARLPTEAEWEKAARGIDGRTYPWGEEIDCKKANYIDTCVGDTSKVGSYAGGVSPYGLFDMAGNVWEWMNDWYVWNYYANSPSSNPQGPSSGQDHSVRGGSWLNGYYYARSALRYQIPLPDYNNSLYVIGFRCARSAE
jgi:serine/threonine protein kinase